MSFYELSDGQQLPAVGFGTYKLNGITGAHAITSAIKAGYRLLDTTLLSTIKTRALWDKQSRLPMSHVMN